ncbi:MAG: hypothetical protein COA72_07025, partial [Candidatus Neomarinimicrobiota bacterium]
MKTLFSGRILPLFILISCGQPPAVVSEEPKIKQVSTFDVALDRETQSKLESQFDAVLNPQNLDDWMKHMSSKPHHVGSPWSKKNAEFIAQKFESWGFETEIETFEHDTRYKIRNSLLETELVSTITNALPFGAEVSVLMSNDSLFPTDTTWEQLGIFRDSLAARGLLNESDSLYILRKCSDISPDSGLVYIFNVMTDFSECFDGLPYIVKYTASGTDTIISYVDTLFKFSLPNPESYYGADDSTGYPEGMVAVPGFGVYASTIDTSQIFLLTDYGSHYTMPRFHLPGTDSIGVFISVEDYLEISSFITFRLSSSGAFGAVNPELIITYPNGGQTLYTDQTYEILWSVGGESEEKVDLYYSTTGDSATYKSANCVLTDNWTEIESGLSNLGSYSWDLSTSGLSET